MSFKNIHEQKYATWIHLMVVTKTDDHDKVTGNNNNNNPIKEKKKKGQI